MNPQEPQPKRYAVVAVIFEKDRFLVIQRSLTETAPGAYCFPGGEIEPNESESQALLRELQEEIGVDSATPVRRLWRSTTARNVDIAWWLTKLPPDCTIHPNPDEVADVMWMTIPQMVECEELLDSNTEFLNQWTRGRFG